MDGNWALSTAGVTLIANKNFQTTCGGTDVSLFGNNNYQYRETFFVMFQAENCPSADKIKDVLSELGPRYETVNLVEGEGGFEAMTVKSPRDFSAMDIVLTTGEEVEQQLEELQDVFRTMTLTGDDMKKMSQIQKANARFDIFHFEEIATATDDDQFLDPGGLLLVLEALAGLCEGVALDPQSQSLM